MQARLIPASLHLLLLLGASNAAQGACDPLLGDGTVLSKYQIELEGREHVTQAVVLPPRMDVGVVLHEQGVDAVLEVRAGGTTIHRADSPIQRSGIQRVLFHTSPNQVYAVAMIGKEPRGRRGRLELYIVALPPAALPESPCTVLHRTVARAEAHYAIGQSITNGADAAAAGTANKAYQRSAALFGEAAAGLIGAEPAPLLALVQHGAAAAFYDGVRNFPQAARWAARASASYAGVGDDYGRARADVLHAAALIEAREGVTVPGSAGDNLDRARQLLLDAASFHAARGETYDQAVALNHAGESYYYGGLYQSAVASYRQALSLHEHAGEHLAKIQVMGNLALVEYELGRLSSALSHFAEALAKFTPSEQPTLYINLLNNSALTNHAAGNIDLALQQYDAALQFARRIQDPFYEALSLYGLAVVYAKLGESERALEHHESALLLRTVDLDAAGRVDSLKSLANALRDAGRAAQAQKWRREALELAKTPIINASVRIELARDLAARGEAELAEQQLTSVLQHRTPGDDFVRACALLARAEQRIARGVAHDTAADLRAALKIFDAFYAVEHQFRARVALARHALLIRQPQQALLLIDHTLVLAETLRRSSANLEFRAQLQQRLRPAFDLKIALLADGYFSSTSSIERKRFADLIVDTAERARARALVDFARLDLNGSQLPKGLLQRRDRLYRELAARMSRLTEAAERLRADRPRMASIRADIADLRRELDRVEAQLAKHQDGPAAGSLAPVNPRSTLPDSMAVVEYWLGEQQALAWTATREATVITRLGPTAEILGRAADFTAALRGLGTVPLAPRLRTSSRLAQLIWQPLASRLAGKQTLVFIPDRALHYVPFAALTRESGGFLIEAHDVATTPSLGTLLRGLSSQPRNRSRRLLLVDDPVFSTSDSRLAHPAAARSRLRADPQHTLRSGRRSRALVRLPATAQEATLIASLLPADRVVRLQGFAATKERLLASDLRDFAYIHLATHADVDEQIPQLSALVLTSVNEQGDTIDDRLMAADLISARLNAELVVLSACDTARGKQIVGEGLIGLRYIALARGARSVVSSLWPVPDVIAEMQMRHLYSALFRQGSSAVRASSQAMRQLLKAKLEDPALWSAFELTIGGIDGPLDTDTPGGGSSQLSVRGSASGQTSVERN